MSERSDASRADHGDDGGHARAGGRASHLRRTLRTAGAALGLAALAGCSTVDTDPDAGKTTPDAPAGTTAESTPSTTADASRTAPTTSTTGSPAATTGLDAGTVGTPGTVTGDPATATDCESREASLESELEQLNQDVEFANGTLAVRRQQLAEQQGIRGRLPGGYDQSTLDRAQAVGESLRPSVVYLDVQLGEFSTATATGWFVEEDLVLTNAHNVRGATSITGYTVDGAQFDATVAGAIEGSVPDVALLRTAATGTPLPTGDSTALSPGDQLVQVGHPGGYGNWVISTGVLVERTSVYAPDDTKYGDLRSSVVGRQGVSGSPVATLDGDVIGMTYGGEPMTQRGRDEAPEPSASLVYDWPIAARTWGSHVPVEVATTAMADWV